MNDRVAKRAVSKSATPKNMRSKLGVYLIPRKRDNKEK
jgi:hypothetical protein